MELTYSTYLRIPELLALQVPESDGPEHDEMLFIVIHQVYELWFKQQLHEGDYLAQCLVEGHVQEACATLKRMLTILKTMVQQVDVLETMTPVSFLSFRSFLSNSSGFQSAQFREFEFLLGNKNPRVLAHNPAGSSEHAAIAARWEKPTLWDAFGIGENVVSIFAVGPITASTARHVLAGATATALVVHDDGLSPGFGELG